MLYKFYVACGASFFRLNVILMKVSAWKTDTISLCVSQIVSFMETWLGKFAKFVTGSTLIEAALAK